MYWSNLELKQQKPWWEVEKPKKYCNPLSAPGIAGRILYYNVFLYPSIWRRSLRTGNSKTSPRDYAAISIFFPTLSSAETVQVAATIPHCPEEKWLSRCPLKKASLLGCLPLLAMWHWPGSGRDKVSNAIEPSKMSFLHLLNGFLHLFCCCSAVPDKRKFAFRMNVPASQLVLFLCCLSFGFHLMSSVGECSVLWAKWRRHSELSIAVLQKPGYSSLPVLHPCSAGDRRLQGMLKTA